ASPTSTRSSWDNSSRTRVGRHECGSAAGGFEGARGTEKALNVRARPDRLPRGKRAIGARKMKLNDLRCRTQRVVTELSNFDQATSPHRTYRLYTHKADQSPHELF